MRGVGSATVVPAVERGLSAGGVRAMKMSKSGCAHLSCSTAKRAVSSSSLTGGKSSGARRDNFPHRASTHLYCTMAGMATRSYLINRSNPSSPSASFAHWYASAAPPPTPTVVRPRARRSIAVFCHEVDASYRGVAQSLAGSLRAERARGVAQSLARKRHFRAPVPSALDSYLEVSLGSRMGVRD